MTDTHLTQILWSKTIYRKWASTRMSWQGHPSPSNSNHSVHCTWQRSHLSSCTVSNKNKKCIWSLSNFPCKFIRKTQLSNLKCTANTNFGWLLRNLHGNCNLWNCFYWPACQQELQSILVLIIKALISTYLNIQRLRFLLVKHLQACLGLKFSRSLTVVTSLFTSTELSNQHKGIHNLTGL